MGTNLWNMWRIGDFEAYSIYRRPWGSGDADTTNPRDIVHKGEALNTPACLMRDVCPFT